MQKNCVYSSVGALVLAAFFSLVFIIFNASFLDNLEAGKIKLIAADFDNISGLRKKAPVKIAGVRVGEVKAISLNKQSYQAHVVFKINDKFSDIPVDSEARILTEGLLGGKYVGIEPGLSEQMLSNNGKIGRTVSSMVLENLIGKLMLSLAKQ